MISVDQGSHVPPFEQVREQIGGLIADGSLAPGARLPPVRRLAADLGLAPNTVARAYRELEHAGLVRGRGARGTFVLPAAEERAGGRAPDPSAVRAAARELARSALRAGLGRDELLALVAEEWDGAKTG
nr:GntR family transcriptional regulator [Nocardiopsis potens]